MKWKLNKHGERRIVVKSGSDRLKVYAPDNLMNELCFIIRDEDGLAAFFISADKARHLANKILKELDR